MPEHAGSTPTTKKTLSTPDHNRATRQLLHLEIDRLWARLTDPHFKGRVVVDIPAANGRLGDCPQFSVIQHGFSDL